jgi:hypothetical protein
LILNGEPDDLGVTGKALCQRFDMRVGGQDDGEVTPARQRACQALNIQLSAAHFARGHHNQHAHIS